MNFNYNADMKYARLVCERSGMSLTIDAVNTQPRTNYSTIILPPLDPAWSPTSVEYRQWWFYLIHEAYHNKHLDDLEMLKENKVKPKSFLGTIVNIAMDFKIETVNRGVFAGRDKLVKEARYAFAAENIYRNLSDGDGTDPMKARLAAVWVHDALCRISWIPEYKDDNLAGLLGPEGTQWLEKILRYPGLSDLYSDQKRGVDTYEVSIMILKALELDPEDDDVTEEPEPSGSEGGGDGDDDGWIKFSEMFVDQHDTLQSDVREGNLHIEYDKPDSGSWIPMEFRSVNMDVEYPDPIKDRVFADELAEKFQHCNLSKKIRRELQSVSRTRFESGKRRGRLHKRSLHKVVNDDGKLFRQRQVRFSPKSTAVMLLQDWSGSMGHSKRLNASTATHDMARVLKSLQIPFSIEGFSTIGGNFNQEMIFKSFNESWNSDKFKHRCVVARHHQSCNADGDYILKAASTLMLQKAQRRILFVLSDGSPAAYDKFLNEGIVTFTKKVIATLETVPGFEIYGIGIEDDNVVRLYKNHCVIKRSDELEVRLLQVLRSKILEGMVS